MLPGEMTETQWIILSHDVNLVCLPNFSSLDYIGVVGKDGLLLVRRIEKLLFSISYLPMLQKCAVGFG